MYGKFNFKLALELNRHLLVSLFVVLKFWLTKNHRLNKNCCLTSVWCDLLWYRPSSSALLEEILLWKRFLICFLSDDISCVSGISRDNTNPFRKIVHNIHALWSYPVSTNVSFYVYNVYVYGTIYPGTSFSCYAMNNWTYKCTLNTPVICSHAYMEYPCVYETGDSSQNISPSYVFCHDLSFLHMSMQSFFRTENCDPGILLLQAVMDNGRARQLDIAHGLQAAGDLISDPFEVSPPLASLCAVRPLTDRQLGGSWANNVVATTF